MSAVISPCEEYRYVLTRPCEVENPERGAALFLMLNPSTADAEQDDPTIRRCRGFARAWSCDGLVVANLYALRSSDPGRLWSHADPVGPDNDTWLVHLARAHADVFCAWGGNASPDRVRQVVGMIQRETRARLWCLGETKYGAPRHPLYIKASQLPVSWKAPAEA